MHAELLSPGHCARADDDRTKRAVRPASGILPFRYGAIVGRGTPQHNIYRCHAAILGEYPREPLFLVRPLEGHVLTCSAAPLNERIEINL